MTDTVVYGSRGARGSGTSGAGSGNPFLVGSIDTTTPFSGTRLLDDGAQLATAIENRDWVSGALAGVSGVLDAVSFALNPILDHLDPLKTWLNDLTGDAGAVTGGAETWARVSAGLQQSGAELLRSLRTTLGEATSQALDAYQRLASDIAAHLGMASDLAQAISVGLKVAASIVQVVHDLVRDAIGDVVGTAISCLIPLPTTIADLVAKVAKWVARITSKLKALVHSFSRLDGLFRQADGLLARLRSVFEKIARPVQALDKLTNDLGESIAKTAREVSDIASAWVKPRFRTRPGLPTAKQELESLLAAPDTVAEFARRGMQPWSMDDLLARQVSIHDLGANELEMMAHLRERVGLISGDTVISKFHLTQGDLPSYNQIRGFTARTQDLQGLDSGQAFAALRGDYAKPFEPGELPTAWNHHDPSQPLFETRVAADRAMTDRTSIAYSSDMVTETGGRVPAGTGVGETAFDANRHDPTGPYTGHGFTAGTEGTVVPENYSAPDRTPGVQYQETYNHDTGRRTSIVVHQPFSRDPSRAIRIPTLW
jgi:ABC-type transporter Mla subunit MlaD